MLHYIDTQPLVTQAWPTGFGRLRTQTRTQMTKVYRLNHYTIKIQKVTQTIDIDISHTRYLCSNMGSFPRPILCYKHVAVIMQCHVNNPFQSVARQGVVHGDAVAATCLP